MVEFENKFGDILAETTGLVRANVGVGYERYPRPRPSADVDWASIAVTKVTASDYPYIDLDGLGVQAEVTVIVTLYGYNALSFMGAFRNRLQTQASRDSLDTVKAAYKEFGDERRVPELINQQWFNRVDADVTMVVWDATPEITQTFLGIRGMLFVDKGKGIVFEQDFSVSKGS